MAVGKPLLEFLERMRIGGLVVDADCQVCQLNNSAKRVLRERDGSAANRTSDPDWRQALTSILRSNGRVKLSTHEETWALLGNRCEPSGLLIVHSVPIKEAGVHKRAVLILLDLNTALEPAPEPLQKIFGLTRAESRLASEMAKGRSLDEIATSTDVAIGTVRKQLASIYAKTGTHRQARLVALLSRVSALP